jgi:glycosyltransferase involved in cell wall biosynthesis
MRNEVARLLNQQQFDLVQVHQAYLSPLVPETTVPMLLDMHDILSDHEYRIMKTKTKWSHRFAGWTEWKKMQALERRTVRRFRVCVTASERDKASLLRLVPDAEVVVVPNGVDTEYFQYPSGYGTGMKLCFVGSMNYGPNSDGIAWFYESIFPRVRQQMPGAKLIIVGYEPPPAIQALDRDPAVSVTGFVHDVRPYLAGSSVVVVPIRLGSGTRMKILDAWAMGKAVVSTSLGAEGLKAAHGENTLIADEPEEFASYVVSLLRDRNLRAALGRAGRGLVEEEYAWSVIGSQMETAYECTM